MPSDCFIEAPCLPPWPNELGGNAPQGLKDALILGWKGKGLKAVESGVVGLSGALGRVEFWWKCRVSPRRQ